MKSSTKGVLLSGIVLPGLGQMAQKHYWRGVVLMLIVVGSFYVVVRQALQQATAIADELLDEGGPIDATTITDAARQAAAASANLTYRIGLLAILACWIISIVDAYVAGRRIDSDRDARSSSPSPTTGDAP